MHLLIHRCAISESDRDPSGFSNNAFILSMTASFSSLVNYTPLEPNPLAPRSVQSSSVTSLKIGCSTFWITI